MATDLKHADVTGWLPETTREFDNAIHAFEITEHRCPPLDEDRLQYFEVYAEKNFNGPLEPGMGTEDILSALSECDAVSDWLELGAGTSTLFWATALPHCQSITAVDASPEALTVLKRIVRGKQVPRCYLDALSIYDRNPDHLMRMRALPWRYLVFDFSEEWPQWAPGTQYGLITAFGCFGLDSGAPHFRQSFALSAQKLAAGGSIVGANWLRSRQSIEAEGYDTSFLTPEFIGSVFDENTIRLKQATIIPIKAGDRYKAMLLWAGMRPHHDPAGTPA